MERHGCYNRKAFKDLVQVQDGWFAGATPVTGKATRMPRMVLAQNVNSRDCQYTKATPADPKCAGCSWQAQPPDTQSAGATQ